MRPIVALGLAIVILVGGYFTYQHYKIDDSAGQTTEQTSKDYAILNSDIGDTGVGLDVYVNTASVSLSGLQGTVQELKDAYAPKKSLVVYMYDDKAVGEDMVDFYKNPPKDSSVAKQRLTTGDSHLISVSSVGGWKLSTVAPSYAGLNGKVLDIH